MTDFGINHPTTQPGNYNETDTALVLTHPFERYEADEEEITDMLEEQEHDSVFYVGQSKGRTPVHVATLSDIEENKQSQLPPGFEDGHYERGLEEESWGELTEEEIFHLLENYDEIEVGGAHRDHCVSNTLDSLTEERRKFERYAPVEISLNEDFTYGGDRF